MAVKTEFNNDYRLPNKDMRITDPDELDHIFDDFVYCAENYMQITDKNGNLRPFKFNRPQRILASKLLSMIMKETRLNRKHNLVIPKPRQIGASTLTVALVNFMCAYVEGFNNMHIYHIFPVGASGGKFYNAKVLPILTGVHPAIYPTMKRTFTDSTTKEITYIDTKGAPRNNRYEIVSANASSLRGGTGQVLILDEVADYTRPYDLEAAISPAIPDYGFSLVMYLSTFSDKRSPYFLEKIKTAAKNPDDWTLMFIPWYFMYPEVRQGINVDGLTLTDYDRKVIIPAMEKDGLPKEEWGDAIAWYHKTELEMPLRIKQEFPTTIEEILSVGANESVFTPQDIEMVKKAGGNLVGANYDLTTNVLTGKVEAKLTDTSPLRIFRKPAQGRRYMLIADPITSASDESDFFAASVFDTANNEQVATIRGRGLAESDWAIMTEALAKLYNRAQICPESNVAEGFKATIWSLGYYNWYYVNAGARKLQSPGIRTTNSSKREMVERLQYLIRNNGIIIHDEDWIHELEIFEKKVKNMSDGRSVVTFSAPGKQHDDTVATLWIYAGTLRPDQLKTRGEKRLVVAGG